MTAPQNTLAVVQESTAVIRAIMEFIRLHHRPGGFDATLAERRVNARLDQIEAACADAPLLELLERIENARWGCGAWPTRQELLVVLGKAAQ